MKTRLHLGDCRDVMRGYPDATFTAICTDPPYGLSFMGKGWDRGVPGVEFWTEALRVLKPGGMLFAFGGTRTSHRLTCAIEDAGFEIRDSLAWIYGQGFPKSLAIDKAIDRKRDDLEEIYKVTAWIRSARDRAGSTNRQIDEAFGVNGMAGHWTSPKSQPAVPKPDQWANLLALLKVQAPEGVEALVRRLNARKGELGEDWQARHITGRHAGFAAGKGMDERNGRTRRDTNRDAREIPATETSAPWQGYGTALKPAHEPCTVAMKPLDGTFAQTALAHGVAGVNVDGGRIGTEGTTTRSGKTGDVSRSGAFTTGHSIESLSLGRWPANVAFDESQARALDEQSGELQIGSRSAGEYGIAAGSGCYGEFGSGEMPAICGSSGGASRFFYVAKPSTAEKTEGMDPDEVAFHPTTKPVELMRWIVRLCKMPEGTHVLDPFAGSGTTGIACQMEGVDCTLIEREREYLETITIPRLRGPKDTMFPPEVEVLGLDDEDAA
jgi:hypothetical protein